MKESSSGFTVLQVVLGLLLGLLAAGVLAVVIVTTVILPAVLKSKVHANEISAIASLHAIYNSQLQYQTAHPADGFACSLQTLESDPALMPELIGDQKNGYTFNIGNCTKLSANGHDSSTGYQATAVPQTIGQTGIRGFCLTEQGDIKADPAGGVNCTEALQ
jgi:type IV pilus assembly protein PilA